MKILLLILFYINIYAYDDFYYVQNAPIQKQIKSEKFKKNGFILNKLYSYKMRARVVSNKKYSWDTLSHIATHDMGVTWQDLSKTHIFNLFDWKHHNRLLYFSGKKKDVDLLGGIKKLNTQLANVHLIPKNFEVEQKLNKIKSYDIIDIDGYLVDVFNYSTNEAYYTSDSRSDEGAGACEIIYVEDVSVVKKSIDSPFYAKKKSNIDVNRFKLDNAPGEGTRSKRFSNGF